MPQRAHLKLCAIHSQHGGPREHLGEMSATRAGARVGGRLSRWCTTAASQPPPSARAAAPAAETLKDQTVEEVEAQARARRVQHAEDAKPAAKDEVGGPKGKEPTRYGDWERKGRVSDF